MGSINTINSSNPTYTAPDDTTTVTLEVIDTAGDYASTTVSVSGTGDTSSGSGNNPTPVVISPSSGSYVVGQAITLTTTGGVPPYTYSIAGGSGGSFSSQTTNQVIFNAPSSPGSAVIQVTDSESLVASTTITFVAQPTSLTLTPGSGSVGTGQTIVFEAFGGVGPYVYSAEGGAGSFEGSTYFASATPATATIVVTDKATGKTATTTLQINATYSTAQIQSTFQLQIGRYAAITYDNDPTAGPSLEVFGTGPNANGSSIGYDSHGDFVCDEGVECTQNIPLSNFGTGAPVTYRGTVEIQGQSATLTVGYCIPPTNTNIAYLNQAPTKSQFYSQVGFDGSEISLFNGDLTETFFTNVNSESYAGYAVVTFLGGFTNNANCSDFPSTSYQVEVDN
jgi:hypothetical protein